MYNIESWSLHGITLPYEKPITWAHVTEPGAPLLLLRLVGSDGAVGVGEVSVRPTWYGAGFKSLVGALEETFIPILKELDVSSPAAFVAAAKHIPENSAAKTLIDNALWDLHAAHSREPLWKKWGGDQSAQVCWLVSRQPREAMVAEALYAVEELGIRTLKMKGGQGIDFDLDVVRSVRTAAGASAQLFVDANWHYTEAETPEYIRRMAELGVVALEDPYAMAPNDAFRRIQRESPVPLIVDFFASSLREVELFREHGMQALSLKPARIGLTECLAQAAYAREREILVHLGFGGESSVGAFTSLQLAGSLWCRNSWIPAEVIFFLKIREDLLAHKLTVRDGSVQLPKVNSISELLDLEKLERLSDFQLRG